MIKHIRLYNTEYHPKMGGIITHMQDVSNELVSKGYQVDIVCDQCNADSEALVPVLRVPQFEPQGLWQKVLRHQGKVNHLFQHLPNSSDVDIHWPREAHYARAALEKYGSERVLYIMPTVFPRMLDCAKDWGLKNKMRSVVFRPQIKKIESEVVLNCHVAVDSQARKDEVIAFYNASPERIHVIPLGVDLKRFSQNRLKQNSVPTGLTVARLSPEKGLQNLLEALALLKGKDWQWIIIGEGWMRPELEKMRARLGLDCQVQFVGAVDSKEYYAEADLFVLPSHYEGFGLVLLEAMANALPCIAFSSAPPEVITASSEIIVHEKTGLVAEAMNIEQMAVYIERLLSNQEMCKVMGASGYKRVAEQYTWEKCVDGYLKISENLL